MVILFLLISELVSRDLWADEEEFSLNQGKEWELMGFFAVVVEKYMTSSRILFNFLARFIKS